MWTKKIGEFRIGQSVQKLSENYGKALFYKTNIEESIINQKPIIRSKGKIITKLEQKNGRVWFYEKCSKIARKLRKIFIL